MKKDPQKDWTTVPALPCIDIVETLDFWEALGFQTTYKQTAPYQYGVVQQNGHAIHFFRLKGLNPDGNYSTCLIVVGNAAETYTSITQALKRHLGKVPHSGRPRVSRMKPEATRFTLTDVSGNSIIVVSNGEKDQETWEEADNKDQSRLQRALSNARRFRDYKNDDPAAAKVLDVALRQTDTELPSDIAEALLMRIELAESAGDMNTTTICTARLNALNLSDNLLATLRNKHRSLDE
jgi:hypothetical protein